MLRMKFYISKSALRHLQDFDTFVFYKNKQNSDDICFVKESDFLREKTLNQTTSEYMDMCESLSSQLESKVKTATIEDLRQNEHIKGLLEVLKFYANLDNWEVSAIDDLCTVKTKLTKDKESFGECEQAGLASKLVIYGGRRARTKLREWE